jgi:hypothetical protein
MSGRARRSHSVHWSTPGISTESEGTGRVKKPEIPGVAVGVIFLAVVWFAGKSSNPGPIGFPVDDAWIHMVYGRGLLADGLLAYNPGVPSTGCTSPLWAIGLALCHALFGGAESIDARVAAVFALGATSHLACVTAGSRVVGYVTKDSMAAAVGGMLIALAVPLAVAAFSGMEVALTGFLLLAGVGAVLRGSPLGAGITFALAFLARPESSVVAALAFLYFAASPSSSRSSNLARFVLPIGLVVSLWMAYQLAVSGSPLPSTYHAKSALRLTDLPARLATVVARILPTVPPLGAGLGWFALAGYFVARRRPSSLWLRLFPLGAGVAYLAANVAIIAPDDPAAFYHVRYVLPAVPALLVGLAIGASGLGARLPEQMRNAPSLALLGLSVVGAALTVGDQSRHLHNDVRNINEVQRAIGEQLGRTEPPGTWIAASDAGAVRYFSGLPTVDVIGLNTPQMLERNDAFIEAHPVSAFAVMPAWFRVTSGEGLEVDFRATTKGYTVTSNRRMGTQLVVSVRGNRTDPPRRIRFSGFRAFELDFLPRPAAGEGS